MRAFNFFTTFAFAAIAALALAASVAAVHAIPERRAMNVATPGLGDVQVVKKSFEVKLARGDEDGIELKRHAENHEVAQDLLARGRVNVNEGAAVNKRATNTFPRDATVLDEGLELLKKRWSCDTCHCKTNSNCWQGCPKCAENYGGPPAEEEERAAAEGY